MFIAATRFCRVRIALVSHRGFRPRDICAAKAALNSINCGEEAALSGPPLCLQTGALVCHLIAREHNLCVGIADYSLCKVVW